MEDSDFKSKNTVNEVELKTFETVVSVINFLVMMIEKSKPIEFIFNFIYSRIS